MGTQICRCRFPANTIRICIDQYENQKASGRMYCILWSNEKQFFSIKDMLLQTDALLDKTGRPQSFQSKRIFQKVENKWGEDRREVSCEESEKRQKMSEEEIVRQRGTYATANLVIQSRKHTSWQGMVMAEDGSLAGIFESELQLIRIIQQLLRRKIQNEG